MSDTTLSYLVSLSIVGAPFFPGRPFKASEVSSPSGSLCFGCLVI
jgi:hypothetical protein